MFKLDLGFATWGAPLTCLLPNLSSHPHFPSLYASLLDFQCFQPLCRCSHLLFFLFEMLFPPLLYRINSNLSFLCLNVTLKKRSFISQVTFIFRIASWALHLQHLSSFVTVQPSVNLLMSVVGFLRDCKLPHDCTHRFFSSLFCI